MGQFSPTGFNGTVGGANNSGYGAAFVPGTRSVLFFSAIGTGPFYYGEASDANDSNRTDKGSHSVGGNYTWQVRAYDANDFVAVKNGQKNPWDVTPYATWNFTLPTTDGAKYMGGVAFDPATGRLYFSEVNVDNSRGQYDNDPLIQVFQISPYPQRHPSRSPKPPAEPVGWGASCRRNSAGRPNKRRDLANRHRITQCGIRQHEQHDDRGKCHCRSGGQ